MGDGCSHIELLVPGLPLAAADEAARAIARALSVAHDDVRNLTVTPARHETVTLRLAATPAAPEAAAIKTLEDIVGAGGVVRHGTLAITTVEPGLPENGLRAISRSELPRICEAALRAECAKADAAYREQLDDAASVTKNGTQAAKRPAQLLIDEAAALASSLGTRIEEAQRLAEVSRSTLADRTVRSEEVAKLRQKIGEERDRRDALIRLAGISEAAAAKAERECHRDIYDNHTGRLRAAIDRERGRGVLLSKECGRLAQERAALDASGTAAGTATTKKLDEARAAISAVRSRYVAAGGVDVGSLESLNVLVDDVAEELAQPVKSGTPSTPRRGGVE